MKKILEKLNALPIWEIACLTGGLLFIVFGSFAVSLLIRIAGIAIIIYTAYRILALFRLADRDFFFAIRFFAHLFTLFVGTVLTVAPSEALSFVGLMAGLYLAIYSGWQLYRLFLIKSIGFRDGIFTGLNILCFLAGLFLIFFRAALPNAISLILGIALLLEGGNGLYRFLREKKRLRQEEKQSGVIYADNFDDKSNTL